MILVILFRILIMLLPAAVCMVLLQLFLAKQEGRWLGLLLPAMTFMISILLVIYTVSYPRGRAFTQSTSEDGTIVLHEIKGPSQDLGTLAGKTVGSLVIFNIPTGVLAAIYAVHRDKRRQRPEAEKTHLEI